MFYAFRLDPDYNNGTFIVINLEDIKIMRDRVGVGGIYIELKDGRIFNTTDQSLQDFMNDLRAIQRIVGRF